MRSSRHASTDTPSWIDRLIPRKAFAVRSRLELPFWYPPNPAILKIRSHFGNVGVGEGNSPSGNGRENLASLWRDLQFLRYRVDRRGHPDGDKGKVQPVREVQKLV
jgi:hypothetical protein